VFHYVSVNECTPHITSITLHHVPRVSKFESVDICGGIWFWFYDQRDDPLCMYNCFSMNTVISRMTCIDRPSHHPSTITFQGNTMTYSSLKVKVPLCSKVSICIHRHLIGNGIVKVVNVACDVGCMCNCFLICTAVNTIEASPLPPEPRNSGWEEGEKPIGRTAWRHEAFPTL
jgi:hypothetical protein